MLVLIFGIFLICIPLSPVFRNYAITFVGSSDSFLMTCGFLLFMVAVLLLIASYSTTKGVSLTLTMGEKGSYTVDERVLNKLLKEYFKSVFTRYEVTGQFYRNQIGIVLEMPAMPFIEQKPLLEKIEKDLADIFEEQFGYSAPFSLSATITEEK
ncbi:MAG: hypothetical protein WCN87_03920 [Chlamydiota bacterium]